MTSKDEMKKRYLVTEEQLQYQRSHAFGLGTVFGNTEENDPELDQRLTDTEADCRKIEIPEGVRLVKDKDWEDFLLAILHGDDAHKQWLIDVLEEFKKKMTVV